jgi:signal transduction histidine kinase
MIAPKDYINEPERLKDLESYSILDTLEEKDYDDMTAIAAEICGTPIALISLIDDKRQWFKSHHGLNATETPKEIAFCAHAINDPEHVFIIQDARTDIRFHDNPLVTKDPHVIFYAGVPLISENNFPLGTLCVIDHTPKILSQSQIQSLTALANQVVNLLKLRKSKFLLEESIQNLEEKNQELEQFAFIAAHDLKSPLIGISGMVKLFTEEYNPKINPEGRQMLCLIESSADKLIRLIDGLLDYSRSESILKEDKSVITLDTWITDIEGLFSYGNNLKLSLKTTLNTVFANKTALDQILINLVANAIKYNDKSTIEIEIGISENDTFYELYVQDNGPGIAREQQDRIFNIFETGTRKDRFGRPGNGIGLATVKKIVKKSGGFIKVESELGNGSTFIFKIGK